MKSALLTGLIASLVIAFTLALGLPHINLNHYMHLPDVNKNRIVVTHSIFHGTTYDIRLGSELKGTQSVDDIDVVLAKATSNDKIIFHLAGVGGNVETAFELINNIKASKAEVIMIVEAPVYSAHAYLALSGDRLIMRPLSSLMLHTSSAFNHDCSKEKGIDRAQFVSETCQNFMTNHFKLVNESIASLNVITVDEMMKIAGGKDVYITATEYYKRTGTDGTEQA